MKSFAIIAFVVCLAAAVTADNKNDMKERSYGGGGAAAPAAAPSHSAPAAPSYSAPAPASIPAPPCPKSYLFSCQPSLTPAPCAPPAASYGASGSHTQNYPVYAVPQYQYANGFQSYY